MRRKQADVTTRRGASHGEQYNRQIGGAAKRDEMETKRTEIVIESYEVLTVKHRGGLKLMWCARCEREQAALSVADLCALGASTLAILQQAESGRIHLIEPGPLSFVCVGSVVAKE